MTQVSLKSSIQLQLVNRILVDGAAIVHATSEGLQVQSVHDWEAGRQKPNEGGIRCELGDSGDHWFTNFGNPDAIAMIREAFKAFYAAANSPDECSQTTEDRAPKSVAIEDVTDEQLAFMREQMPLDRYVKEVARRNREKIAALPDDLKRSDDEIKEMQAAATVAEVERRNRLKASSNKVHKASTTTIGVDVVAPDKSTVRYVVCVDGKFHEIIYDLTCK